MLQQPNQSSHQPSLYSQLTDKIIAELEQGIVPWCPGSAPSGQNA